MVSPHKAKTGVETEEILQPDLPICDPHQHLLENPVHYLLEDFLKDAAGGHNIIQTVAVECGHAYKTAGPVEFQPVGETVFLDKMYFRTRGAPGGKPVVASGIVAFADLAMGISVSQILEAHVLASQRFRGIRFSTIWDKSGELYSRAIVQDFLSDTKVRNGFTQLRQLDLTFDAWLYFHQLPGLVDLANAFPGTTIIADHIGGPVGIGPYTGKRNEVFLEWRKNMTALAACPNVVVKLGGMGMPEMGLGWDKAPQKPDSAEVAEALTPYFTFCIEKFGTKRCMFESNFPADKLAYSYSVVWNAFKRIAADYSAGERADLFHDTAVRVYRL